MEKVLSLKIKFSKLLTENEQTIFWEQLINNLEKHNLYTGGGHNHIELDFAIDYSQSSLSFLEIKIFAYSLRTLTFCVN